MSLLVHEGSIEGLGSRLGGKVEPFATRAGKRLAQQLAPDSPSPMTGQDTQQGEQGLNSTIPEDLGDTDEALAITSDDRRGARRL
jgi:hypothetical protein